MRERLKNREWEGEDGVVYWKLKGCACISDDGEKTHIHILMHEVNTWLGQPYDYFHKLTKEPH